MAKMVKSERDQFAIAALSGLLTKGPRTYSGSEQDFFAEIARKAFALADAMWVEREKEK